MRLYVRFKSAAILFVVLSLMVPQFGATASFAQEETVSNPAPQVNLEIILDSSGSMANLTDTGETRMDAAKRVLSEVISSIPQREGQVNVGFRIYGHRGDNTDATRDESCKASDLLAPVSGVDQPALLAAVNSAQPTGWTPIARSLSRSGKDFPEAGPSVMNTVLLLTDGLETCDGNPVKVAGDLHEKPSVLLTTHVVGFGTTPEEQAVLQGIADEGGGQLFGASNAQQLRTALFDVLEQLQIVVGVGYVGGNAFGILPAGNAGEFSVVGYFQESFLGILSFTLRNNTGADAAGLKVNVTVRDGAGNLLAAGDADQVSPFFVRAGGIAYGNIWLGPDTVLPDDAQYEWKVIPSNSSEFRYATTSDLNIVEAAIFDNRIAGTVKNGFDKIVQGPFEFHAACFFENGAMAGTADGTLDLPQLAPGEEQAFQIDLFMLEYGGGTCPAFFVSGSGRGPVQAPAPPTTSTSVVPTTVPTTGNGTIEFRLPGLLDAALRNFTRGDGATEGLLALSVTAFVFSDGVTASAAFDPILARYFEVHELDPSIAIAATAPPHGAQRKALTFSTSDSEVTIDYAIAVIRDDARIYFIFAAARSVSPLDSIVNVTGKLFSQERVVDPADGALDLLPTLGETPPGLSMDLEQVPDDWGPVPAL